MWSGRQKGHTVCEKEVLVPGFVNSEITLEQRRHLMYLVLNTKLRLWFYGYDSQFMNEHVDMQWRCQSNQTVFLELQKNHRLQKGSPFFSVAVASSHGFHSVVSCWPRNAGQIYNLPNAEEEANKSKKAFTLVFGLFIVPHVVGPDQLSKGANKGHLDCRRSCGKPVSQWAAAIFCSMHVSCNGYVGLLLPNAEISLCVKHACFYIHIK